MFRAAIVVLWVLAVGRLATAQYAGSQACKTCHPARFETQSKTGHAHALSLAASGSPGQWAFGAGGQATTYVSQVDSEWYLEHGLSFYTATRSMALTPGHTNADGMKYRTFDPIASVLRCFRCHSTGPLQLGAGYSIQPSEPGVRCESCHGAGAAHVKSGGRPGTIFNPKSLPSADLNEFCGTCHRKPPEPGQESDWSKPWNIRHEPDYLSHAACFRKSAGALSCLTCHDPHGALQQTKAEYDKRCVSCHRTARHRAVVAARACVDCHMPSVAAGPRLQFTNHWIGIYENGAKLLPSRQTAKNLLPLRPTAGKAPAPADPASFRPLFEQMLADREKQWGLKHSKVARSAADLGLFLESVGDLPGAEPPLRQALAIDRGNADPMLAADKENLAALLVSTRRGEEALVLFRQAAQGHDAEIAARSLAAMAALDAKNAESYYRAALEAEESAVGKNHPRVAILLDDLALALRQRDDNKDAEPLLRRALAIQEKALGPDHPATASTLNNLGSLLQSTGRLAESERLERRALRIFEEKLGPESMELATSCTNLADVLWTKGDRAAAAESYRRALAIDESVYGPDDPEVAADLTNLGGLLKESGQAGAAATYLRRALAIYEKAFGPSSPQALSARGRL